MNGTLKRGLIKGLPVFISASILIAAGIVMFMFVDRVEPDEDNWYIIVRGSAVPEEIRIMLRDLRDLYPVTENIPLSGTGEDGWDHEYTGIRLRDLVSHAGAIDYSKVTVRAADGYSRAFSRSEVEDHDLLLAYEKDGKDLKGRSEGGAGPVRLIVSPQVKNDNFNAQYSVKYVSEVVVD